TRLADVERQELGGSERQGDGDVDKVEATHAQCLDVFLGQFIRGAKDIGPGNCGVHDNVVGQIRVDLGKSRFALLDGDFLAEDAEADAGASLVPVEGCERQRLR